MAKGFRQFKISEPSRNNLLLNGEVVVGLGIHAVPGTVIQIGDNENSKLIIPSTGNFSIDCEDFPITYIRVVEMPSDLQDTIIDIVYRGGVIL